MYSLTLVLGQLSEVSVDEHLTKEVVQCLKKRRQDKAVLIGQSRVGAVHSCPIQVNAIDAVHST